mmetsp:Transcript_82836/g.256027  ORF Transcript_82836/g.256027 Transcript_82836/m.256027 type:complete len:102 (+) Transcript_82836:195-500(+)
MLIYFAMRSPVLLETRAAQEIGMLSLRSGQGDAAGDCWRLHSYVFSYIAANALAVCTTMHLLGMPFGVAYTAGVIEAFGMGADSYHVWPYIQLPLTEHMGC